MRILFMGTPDFAKDSLEALVNAKYNVEAVVTNPDRPKGRGMKMMMSPVKEFALSSGIEKIYQPEKVKNNEEFINEIKQINPDLNIKMLKLIHIDHSNKVEEIEVEYMDINFNKQHGKYNGFIAEIIQHEIDHTNGIII